MGILTRKLGVYAMTLEDPAQPLMPPSALFESLGLGRSDAGVMVNERQALRLPVAYSCIKGISEDLASTAFEVIQELPDESMRTAKTHRLWPILHDEWNPQMASIVGRAAIISSALGWGNGYAWIKRDRAARVVGLYPLESGKTSPVKLKGELKYATTQTDTGVPIYLDPENVLHVMGLSNDGVVGLSPIQLAKNAFGLGIAAEKFGAQFFANGARATGVLSYPGALEEEAEENLKQSLREMATGENANAPVLLEEGMKWEQISINPTDSQFLETRKFQRADIAGMFRYPMHLLGSLERSTNNNIEHQGLDYVRYCLRPWAIRLEHEVNRKLLASPFTAEHNFNDLQRGDFASQTAGLQILRNIGVYSANKCLRVLRQNPISAAEGGDVLT
ncbi:MAG TPA: phage portal protein, partial [Blastocatellia bacterium]|nr:phage portal protein [Blastocatellia bacterium]